jgi:response regulator RpfG family c-di-GMP phosphodiesterase
MAGFFIEHVNKSGSMEAFGVYKFNEAKNMAAVRQPSLAVVEIPERQGDTALDALDVCEDIREASPACKIILICPEQDKKSVEACPKAKNHGRIEDYVFYDCSAGYLASKLESLMPE